MSGPTHPLLRAAEIAAGRQRLGKLTGLSRLGIESHRLNAGDQLTLPDGSEQFLYVVDGTGTITGADAQEAISSGDFITLEATDAATLMTEDTLTVLSGRLSST